MSNVLWSILVGSHLELRCKTTGNPKLHKRARTSGEEIEENRFVQFLWYVASCLNVQMCSGPDKTHIFRSIANYWNSAVHNRGPNKADTEEENWVCLICRLCIFLFQHKNALRWFLIRFTSSAPLQTTGIQLCKSARRNAAHMEKENWKKVISLSNLSHMYLHAWNYRCALLNSIKFTPPAALQTTGLAKLQKSRTNWAESRQWKKKIGLSNLSRLYHLVWMYKSSLLISAD